MQRKHDPRDWDRLFARRRRRGPLAVLTIAVIGGVLVLGLIGLTPFLIEQIEVSRVVANQTQIAIQTREARATAQQAATQSAIPTATATPTLTATPPPPTNTPEPIIGRAQVIQGGNIRSEPRIAQETVIGQVCVGDRVELLAERAIDGNNRWYRLRVIEISGNCVPQRVSVGTEGWVSATLLSQPER
ncbi:SH3 domain-containing protein [Chloroflexus sp.]|uniref:SH3 domain-containing protein n=1 Tax=Chloroflexus sp. TaxID=1904827 RepID=UPI00260759E8|nr:SH3 domain-containing protein [uncultured Chloroflexus sp.]